MSRTSTQPASDDSTVPSASPALHSERATALAATSADLFRSCAAGNCDRAWREFVARFHSRLVTAVRRALLRQGDVSQTGALAPGVEDLVQEVYCRLLGDGSRRRRFQGSSEGQLMTYLQRVAVSVVVDARREALAAKRRGGQHLPWVDWRQAPATGAVKESGPEDRLLVGERRRAFLAICRQALGRRANASTLRIARLALLEGWTSREIADGLGGALGVAGIDSLIHRLRRNLAAQGLAPAAPRPLAGQLARPSQPGAPGRLPRQGRLCTAVCA